MSQQLVDADNIYAVSHAIGGSEIALTAENTFQITAPSLPAEAVRAFERTGFRAWVHHTRGAVLVICGRPLRDGLDDTLDTRIDLDFIPASVPGPIREAIGALDTSKCAAVWLHSGQGKAMGAAVEYKTGHVYEISALLEDEIPQVITRLGGHDPADPDEEMRRDQEEMWTRFEAEGVDRMLQHLSAHKTGETPGGFTFATPWVLMPEVAVAAFRRAGYAIEFKYHDDDSTFDVYGAKRVGSLVSEEYRDRLVAWLGRGGCKMDLSDREDSDLAGYIHEDSLWRYGLEISFVFDGLDAKTYHYRITQEIDEVNAPESGQPISGRDYIYDWAPTRGGLGGSITGVKAMGGRYLGKVNIYKSGKSGKRQFDEAAVGDYGECSTCGGFVYKGRRRTSDGTRYAGWNNATGGSHMEPHHGHRGKFLHRTELESDAIFEAGQE